MKRATKATPRYKAVYKRLTAEGWGLLNYGGGWRYFGRAVPDAPTRGTNPVMRLFETCRVNASGTKVEQLGNQYIAR